MLWAVRRTGKTCCCVPQDCQDSIAQRELNSLQNDDDDDVLLHHCTPSVISWTNSMCSKLHVRYTQQPCQIHDSEQWRPTTDGRVTHAILEMQTQTRIQMQLRKTMLSQNTTGPQ